MEPVLQIALDFVNLQRALKAAHAAVAAGADWLEVGTPLIKSEGAESIRTLRKQFPSVPIVADLKIMDVGRIEAEVAFKAGANMVCVMGVASLSTIEECVRAARNYGGKVIVDLMNVGDIEKRVQEIEEMGADIAEIHISIDDQMRGQDPIAFVKRIAGRAAIPLAVAGGVNSEMAAPLLDAGASVLIVGGAICKAKDPGTATQTIKQAMRERKVVESSLYKRVAGDEGVRGVLEKVSVANVSDAMHRTGELIGLRGLGPRRRLMGKIVTVRTYAGDWAKPVEAIDRAEPGDVLFIDAGGVAPAVWGELATHSALTRGLAGVVVYGAVRDSDEIAQMDLPVYAALVTPTAGEPKGFGEIDVPLHVQGRTVMSGDWLLADGDGLIIIPRARAVEVANRAMDVLERENRIRQEIEEGSTLSSVMELLRWEKKQA